MATPTFQMSNLSGDITVWLGAALGLLVLAIFFHWVKERKERMTLLERHGIPGPKPHLLWGNLREYLATPNVPWDTQLIEEYGPICGYYMGAKPVILISEPNLINRIERSNDYLHRPRRVPGGINPDPNRARMLGNLPVPDWKLLRQILDKGFSPDKLKEMFRDVQKLVDIFMSQLAPVENPNFYLHYQNLTLDLIGKIGFGVNSDIQRNPNDELKAAVEQEFSKSTGTLLLKLCLCLPEIQWLHQPLRVKWEQLKNLLGKGGHSALWVLGAKTVEQRKLDLDQQNQDPDSHTSPSSASNSDLLNVMLKSHKLNNDSVVANSVLFFEAGFETLSASLAFITYLLMKNPEVQETIRTEIGEILGDTDGVLSMEKLKEFNYLDAVISEALRMYPSQTTFISRSGTQDLEHYFTWDGAGQRCTLPKNIHIQIGLYQILNSEEIWDSPRTFSPDRFYGDGNAELSLERQRLQAIAFQPFGRGRRVCIGRKYADMVLKTLFIQLLSKYRLFSTPSQDAAMEENSDIAVTYKTATMTPKNGVIGNVVEAPIF